MNDEIEIKEVETTVEDHSDKSVPKVEVKNKTCADCEHNGVCKYEDTMHSLIRQVSVQTKDVDFLDGFTFGCKFKKVPSLTFAPGVRNVTPAQIQHDQGSVYSDTLTVPITTSSPSAYFQTAPVNTSGMTSATKSIYNPSKNDFADYANIAETAYQETGITTTVNSISPGKTVAMPKARVRDVSSGNVKVERINPDDLPPEVRAKFIKEEVTKEMKPPMEKKEPSPMVDVSLVDVKTGNIPPTQ